MIAAAGIVGQQLIRTHGRHWLRVRTEATSESDADENNLRKTTLLVINLSNEFIKTIELY